MAKVYKPSPFGIFVHPWVNRPDTKFDTDGKGGVFKVDLGLTGAAAQAFKDEIALEAEQAHTLYIEEQQRQGKMKPQDAKKWAVYYPFVEEEDEQGNKTGEVTFKFRQNAVIHLKDGTNKQVLMSIRDSKNKVTHVPVFSGTEGRIMFATRAIPMVSKKEVGVRLDFAMVQIKKLADSSGGQGFDTVDDGYEADEAEENKMNSGAGPEQQGDY